MTGGNQVAHKGYKRVHKEYTQNNKDHTKDKSLANRWQTTRLPLATKRILYTYSRRKAINQKVSFFKTNTIYSLSNKPKIGAKLIFSYGTRKFYARVCAHI